MPLKLKQNNTLLTTGITYVIIIKPGLYLYGVYSVPEEDPVPQERTHVAIMWIESLAFINTSPDVKN